MSVRGLVMLAGKRLAHPGEGARAWLKQMARYLFQIIVLEVWKGDEDVNFWQPQ